MQTCGQISLECSTVEKPAAGMAQIDIVVVVVGLHLQHTNSIVQLGGNCEICSRVSLHRRLRRTVVILVGSNFEGHASTR